MIEMDDQMTNKLENTRAQMRRGVLEMCVLAIISEEEAYPSDIIEKLKRSKLIVVEGTLYPLLNRLKNEKLLHYNWKESNAGPPRKYYYITDGGKVFLEGLNETWGELQKAVKLATKNIKQPEKDKA
jgi:PadR family transcriptional regulator PadR